MAEDIFIEGWRNAYRKLPATDALALALVEFNAQLPGWWWSVGYCKVSGDASCGPDRQGPDADLLEHKEFDEGFHVDIPNGEPAEALIEVTRVALEARQRFRKTAALES